jgi:hypothetical protein
VILDFDDLAMPTHLYKYRAVNADALAMLAADQLYLSRINAFNDPFEFPDLELFNSFVFESRRNDRSSLHSGTHQNNSVQSCLRVCSLSEECQDLLMWGHYGDRHQGFCIRFEFAKDPRLTNMLSRVEYRAELPESKEHAGNPDQLWRMATLTKSEKWSYEREWRIIGRVPQERANTDDLFFSYNPKALTGIIFGVRTPALHKKLVRKILSQHQHIVYYEAVREADRFALSIQEAVPEE